MKEIRCIYCRKYILPKFGNVYWYRDCPFCSNSCRTSYCDKRLIKRKGIKCFSLFFTLFVSALLFGLVESPNTSAIQYEIRSIPLSYYIGVDSTSSSFSGSNLGMGPRLSVYSSGREYSPYSVDVLYTSYNSVSQKCVAPSPFSNGKYSYPSVSTSGSFTSIDYDISGMLSPVQFDNPPVGCRYNLAFGDFPQAPLNEDSYTGILPTQYVNSLKPYWYTASAVYVDDFNTDDGLHRATRLELSDLFGGPVDTFTWLYLPFGLDESLLTGDLTVGRVLELKGSFMLTNASGVDPSSSDFVFYNGSGSFIFNFNLYGYDSVSQSVHSQYASCSYNVIDNRQISSDEAPWEVTFTCPMEVQRFYRDGSYSIALDIRVSPGSNGTLFNLDSKWNFLTELYLITDMDNSPSSSYYGINPTGNDLSNVPGSAGSNLDNYDDVDWFSSLTNLFNFSFLNPFAPLFNMFISNESCANIPIIAGMLGSEEITYCPWFSSTTRNVLTPVLSIVSVMLLFGFIVRWLGSSSGNMFEDQTVHKWNNTQFKQKGS